MEEPIICIICKEPLDVRTPDAVKLRQKGSEGVNHVSAQRNDTIRAVAGQHVHQECRRTYCLPRNVARASKQESQPSSIRTSLV